MSTSDKPSIDFFRWEGDACRLLTHSDGSQTADIYRGGRGILPIETTDLLSCAVQISEEMYKELVLEEIALSKLKRHGE
jgi:hypothetical protein